ncbi:hypothetical protein BDQ17DRAFT_1404684 [Cyathus striatus]|nr:hypothetical protein BDQ17DRAFT_1404684 [Cyathus striatus]
MVDQTSLSSPSKASKAQDKQAQLDKLDKEKEREEEEARPKKRQRVGSEEDAVAKEKKVQRDEEYYLADENANVFVKWCTQKVHENLLYQSPLMKEHHKRCGVTSDEAPIVLIAATVDDFRALLWGLYRLPSAPAEEEYTDDYISLIVSLSTISHTYSYTSLHTWSLSHLKKAVETQAFMDACSSLTLSRIVDVLALNLPLLTIVERKWAERVVKGGTPSVPAMVAADRHSLSHLRGIAYYTHIQDMLDRQVHGDITKPSILHTDPKLSPDQVQRVLSGYLSLVTFWERFRQHPIPLPLGTDCDDEKHEACKALWERRWGSAIGWKRILGHNSADLLGLIECLQDQLRGDEELKAGLGAVCRVKGLEGIKLRLEEARAGLSEHFGGCS